MVALCFIFGYHIVMSLFSAIALGITSLVNFAIGIVVVVRYPRRIVNQAFALFTFGTLLWGIGFVLLARTGNMFFDTITLLGVVVGIVGLGITIDQFQYWQTTIKVLPRTNEKAKGISMHPYVRELLIHVPLLVLALGIPFHIYITDVIITNTRVIPINGPWFWLFVVVVGTYLARILFLLVRNTHIQRSDAQSRSMILLFSILGFVLVASLFDLVLPVFGITTGNYLGFVALTGVVLATAYTLFFEYLFDVRIIVKKVVLYGVLLVITFGTYASILLLAMTTVPRHTYAIDIVVGVMTTFFLVATFPLLDRILRKITDRWLYHGKYQYDTALLRLMKQVAPEFTLDAIIIELRNEVSNIFHARNVKFVIAYQRSSQATSMIHTDKKEDILYVPVIAQGSFVGTIVVAEKLSGARYTLHDQEFMETIAHYLAAKLLLAVRLHDLHIEHQELNTEHRELAESYHSKTRENEQLRRLQDHMITDIAHNLQTPLTILRSELEGLSSMQVTGDQELWLQAAGLESHVEKISQFITRLLQAGKLQTQEYHKEQYDFREQLEEIAEYLITIAEASNIHFSLVHDKVVPIMIHADRELLEQVITNLIGNAFKYRDETKESQHRVTMEVEIQAPHLVVVHIIDNGIGIDSSDVPYLFERWYRAGKTGVIGSGLGLAMVKTIVDAHQGRMKVQSTLGEGTRITVLLPII